MCIARQEGGYALFPGEKRPRNEHNYDYRTLGLESDIAVLCIPCPTLH